MRIQNDPLIPGMDPLEQACRRLEASIDEGGWDQRPRFLTVSLLGGNYATADLDEIASKALPGALLMEEIGLPDFVYMNPGQGLLSFLQFLAEDGANEDIERRRELAQILNSLVPVDFFGFGVVYEAWAVEGSSREEVERFSEDNSIAEHPDRIELRGVIVATRDGRMAFVTRRRGSFPEYEELDPTDENTIREGRLVDGVRMMTSFFVEFDNWRRGLVEHVEAENPN